jgi:hypothetical protein
VICLHKHKSINQPQLSEVFDAETDTFCTVTIRDTTATLGGWVGSMGGVRSWGGVGLGAAGGGGEGGLTQFSP